MSVNGTSNRSRRTVHYRKGPGNDPAYSRDTQSRRSGELSRDNFEPDGADDRDEHGIGPQPSARAASEAADEEEDVPFGRSSSRTSSARPAQGGSSSNPAISFITDPRNRMIVIIVAVVLLAIIIFSIVRCSSGSSSGSSTGTGTQAQTQAQTVSSSTFAIPATGYASPAMHFSIIPPDGWSVDESGVSGSYGWVRFYTDSLPNTSGVAGEFFVMRPEGAVYSDYSSDGAIISRELLDTNVTTCTVQSSSDVTIGVLSGRLVTCNLTYTDGSTRVMREYILGNYGSTGVYALRYEPSAAATDDAVYTAYVDACEASIQTFQLAYVTNDGAPDETAAASAVTTTGTPWTTAVADTSADATAEDTSAEDTGAEG